MADKPYEPLPTKLPTLDSSAARKTVKVTQVADAGQSRSREDVALPREVQQSIRSRTTLVYATLGAVAGVALVLGGPLWVLLAVPIVGWSAGRKFKQRARQGQGTSAYVPIQSAAGLDLIGRVRNAQRAIESMDLNNQIYADLLESIQALPERIRSIESAETQCRTLIEALPQSEDSQPEHVDLLQRIEQLAASRAEIGNVLDALTMQAAQVTADSQLDEAVERKLVLQAQALAQTTKDLS